VHDRHGSVPLESRRGQSRGDEVTAPCHISGKATPRYMDHRYRAQLTRPFEDGRNQRLLMFTPRPFTTACGKYPLARRAATRSPSPHDMTAVTPASRLGGFLDGGEYGNTRTLEGFELSGRTTPYSTSRKHDSVVLDGTKCCFRVQC